VYKPFSLPTTAGIAMWLGLAQQAKTLTGLLVAAEATSTSKDLRRRGLAPEIDGLDEVSSGFPPHLTQRMLMAAGTVKDVAEHHAVSRFNSLRLSI
jgi:hypothetical protein